MQIVESFMFNDQLFNLDNVRSLECFKNEGFESNFLTRSALRLTVPRDKVSSFPPVKFNLKIFKYNNTEFDPYSAESQNFYALPITNKAKYPMTLLVKLLSGLFSINY